MPGAGLSPAGTSPAGFGSPAQAPAPSGSVFLSPTTSQQLDGRLIDPVTRRYVFGANGRIQGQSTVPQLVQIALATVFGSSADPTIGQTFSSLQDIGPNFAQQVTTAVQAALSNLIAQKFVLLLGVDIVTPLPTGNVDGSFSRVRWQDLTTQQPHATPLFPS